MPRVGFLGAGSIGIDGLAALVSSGGADVVAVADVSRERRGAALEIALGFPLVTAVESRLFARGEAIAVGAQVEDFAAVQLAMVGAVVAQIAWSGRDPDADRLIDVAHVLDRIHRHQEMTRCPSKP